MSILFGVKTMDEQVVEESYLRRLASATDRWAPDGTFVRAKANIGMGFQPFHTHERSRLEGMPPVSAQGDMLCFDGRLDNHKDLQCDLELPVESSDSEIVLTAFTRWGEDCFARLIGDWSLALWSDHNRSLYLARDHAGTRTLYYERREGRLLWSTHLETFFVDEDQHDLDEVYASCYLACLPVRDLTPYKGIRSVAPGHWMRFRNSELLTRPHWSALAKDQLHYKTDAEYEEHFFTLFRQAVERRTGPGAPILAELSGGMDSSSIVCMSDFVRRQQGAQAENLLDTISYYDDSEPDWNERPYFEAVEKQRGKVGIHLELPLIGDGVTPAAVPYLIPGADSSTYKNELELEENLGQKDYRVVLSGIGGDELLGGVPTPLPELSDLLVTGSWKRFSKQALKWALIDRTPVLYLTRDALAFATEQYGIRRNSSISVPPWLTSSAKDLLKPVCRTEIPRMERLRFRPSSIASTVTWNVIGETMPHRNPRRLVRREYRYPFLDRDLTDFLLRVPREHLVLPGRRRRLMRSAVREIVPIEVVERRRKASRRRAIPSVLSANLNEILQLLTRSRVVDLGLVNRLSMEQNVMRSIKEADGVSLHSVVRLLLFELWNRQHAKDVSSAVYSIEFAMHSHGGSHRNGEAISLR